RTSLSSRKPPVLGKVRGRSIPAPRACHVRLTCANRSPVTVPEHDELDRGTLRSIIRAAGITPEELIALLEK
ncbi:MAG TPA: type II toxin-antitoxin system HicA family toxin, partial [Polyangiaceae bacterium]|nr:type II toxin-antitoxin system HicA family toxin [Polyangiaceae bacterium]